MATQHQLQYPQSIYQQTQPLQSPHIQIPQQGPQPTPLAQQSFQPQYNSGLQQGQQAIQQQPYQESRDPRFSELERQRNQDIENMNRAGAEINKRLRDLEQSGARVQSDHDAKDREVRRLQEQLAAVERQRRQDAERNSQRLAELVRSQATSPAAQAPAFDMSAIQKVIRETQTQQLSAQDIERVIEEQVSKRLAGMATKADIQTAGAQMQSALSQVPAGLNEQQVQQAVNRELNNVMQDVANRVNQQRLVGGQMQQEAQPWQTPLGHVQTEFVVEELPDEDTVIQPQGVSNVATQQMALPSTGQQSTSLTSPPGAVQHWATHPASAYDGSQAMSSQNSAVPNSSSGNSQYAAIEAGPPRGSDQASLQAYTPVSSIRNNTRHSAAIKVPLVTPMVPGNALASVNRCLPAVSDHPGNALVPSGSNTHQYGLSQAQPQYATALTPPAQQWGVSSPQPIEAARAQRQLEAAPNPNLGLDIAGPRPGNPSYRSTIQAAAQAQQIAGVAPQRQLEAPPMSSTGCPVSGQELVYQGRDLEKQTPRR